MGKINRPFEIIKGAMTTLNHYSERVVKLSWKEKQAKCDDEVNLEMSCWYFDPVTNTYHFSEIYDEQKNIEIKFYVAGQPDTNVVIKTNPFDKDAYFPLTINAGFLFNLKAKDWDEIKLLASVGEIKTAESLVIKCPDKSKTLDYISKELGIVTRIAWNAPAVKTTLATDWDFNTIVIHHSGNAGAKTPMEIYDKHIDEGYDDVAYHYMIKPDGTIYEGRKLLYKGSHVAGMNTKKIGILMMGDYTERDEHPSFDWKDFLDFGSDTVKTTQIEAAKKLIQLLVLRFPIKTLGGHKEFLTGRSCPGSKMMVHVKKIRTDFLLTSPGGS